MLHIEANYHLGLDLDSALAALAFGLKSLLMLASNFLVGIFLSSSRFSFASIGGFL